MCGAKKLKGEEKRDGIAALCAAGKTAGAPLHNSRQLDATGGDAGRGKSNQERGDKENRLEARAPEE